MCAKDEERYIGAAIESVLHQTYENLELLVIDDRSRDRTVEVVRSFRDPRVILYQKGSEPPGLATSKNIGIELARGEFVAYHDADDISHELRIEMQLSDALNGSGERVVGCLVNYQEAHRSRVLRLPTRHDEIVAGLQRSWNRVTFVSGTMLFPRWIGRRIPNRPKFKSFEDWDQLCRIREAGLAEFGNVPKALYTYVVRPKGSKSQSDWSRYNVYERACRARRLVGLPEWESLDDFETYLLKAPYDYARWTTLRHLLEVKVRMQKRRLNASRTM